MSMKERITTSQRLENNMIATNAKISIDMKLNLKAIMKRNIPTIKEGQDQDTSTVIKRGRQMVSVAFGTMPSVLLEKAANFYMRKLLFVVSKRYAQNRGVSFSMKSMQNLETSLLVF